MSKELQNSQFEQLMVSYAKLSAFQMLINDNVAQGYLDDILQVKDENGGYPIVAALGEEPLSLLIERCQAIGGDANILVLTKDGTRYITSEKDDSESPAEEDIDLSDAGQWENGNSEIEFFADWLLQCGKPVTLPGSLPCSLDVYSTNVKLKKDDDEDSMVSSL